MKSGNHHTASSSGQPAAARKKIESLPKNPNGAANGFKPLLTAKEAADWLGVDPGTFQKIRKELNLQYFSLKYFSKPYLTYLLLHVPLIRHKNGKKEIDINSAAEKTVAELFGEK